MKRAALEDRLAESNPAYAAALVGLIAGAALRD
jgi:hypothetical protein